MAPAIKTSDKLLRLLTEVHNQVIKRDSKGIFAKPVSEDVAPDYFSVVSSPMDLGTISSKLMSRSQYSSVANYLCDLRLMCSNAMLYNSPDTTYYQKARKMLAFAEKQLSPMVLRKICDDLGIKGGLTVSDIGDLEQRPTEYVTNIRWPVVTTRTQFAGNPADPSHSFTPPGRIKETSRNRSRKHKKPVSLPDESRGSESGSVNSFISSGISESVCSRSPLLRVSCDISHSSLQNTVSFENSSDIEFTEKLVAPEASVQLTRFDSSPSGQRSISLPTADTYLPPSPSSACSEPSSPTPSRRPSPRLLGTQSSPPSVRSPSLLSPPDGSSANSPNPISPKNSLSDPPLLDGENLSLDSVSVNVASEFLSVRCLASRTSDKVSDSSNHHSEDSERRTFFMALSSPPKSRLKRKMQNLEQSKSPMNELSLVEPKLHSPRKRKCAFRNSTPVAAKVPRYRPPSSSSTKPIPRSFPNPSAVSLSSAHNFSPNVASSNRLYAEDAWSFSDSMTDLTPSDRVLLQIKEAAKRAQEKLLAKYSAPQVLNDSESELRLSGDFPRNRQQIVYLDTSQPGHVRAVACPLASTRSFSSSYVLDQAENPPLPPVMYPPAMIRLLTGSSPSSPDEIEPGDPHAVETEDDATPRGPSSTQSSSQSKVAYNGLVEQMTPQQVSTLHSLSKLRFSSDEPIAADIHGPLAIFNSSQLAELLDLYGGDQTTVEYALSLLNFVEPIGAWARNWAAKKLDVATSGLHSLMLRCLLASRLSKSEEHVRDWMATAGLTIDSGVFSSRISDFSSLDVSSQSSLFHKNEKCIAPSSALNSIRNSCTAVTVGTHLVPSTHVVESCRQTATVQPLQRSEIISRVAQKLDSSVSIPLFQYTSNVALQTTQSAAIRTQNAYNSNPISADFAPGVTSTSLNRIAPFPKVLANELPVSMAFRSDCTVSDSSSPRNSESSTACLRSELVSQPTAEKRIFPPLMHSDSQFLPSVTSKVNAIHRNMLSNNGRSVSFPSFDPCVSKPRQDEIRPPTV